MTDFETRIITEEQLAKEMWDELIPKETVFDDWDFRYCFYKFHKQPLQFIVYYVDKTPVILLPLQINTETGELEYFVGGLFMYNNRIGVKSGFEVYIKNALLQLPSKVLCHNMRITEEWPCFTFENNQYFLDLSKYSNYNDYVQDKFISQSKGKLLRKMRQNEQLGIRVEENIYNDLDLLIDLNLKNFREKSSFLKPRRKEVFHDLLNLGFDVKLFTFVIYGKKEAVTLSIRYKDNYIYVNAGKNKEEFPNLTTYITMYNIDYAIKSGAKFFDAGMEDWGWKELWHFDKIPHFKLEYR